MKVYYFTATGNSLWVAKGISSDIESIAQVDFASGYVAQDDEAIGIVCPTYGFTPPQMVQDFMSSTEFDTPYLFVIGTYGDRYGKFPEVVRGLFKGGKAPDYINCIKMVDNAVHAGYKMQEQLAMLPERRVDERLEVIKADVAERKAYSIPAANPVLSALVLGAEPLTRNQRGGRVISVDDDACVRCGMCAKVCPAGNIVVDERVEIGMTCELCLACVHNCPKGAVHIRHESNSDRYRNAEVTLAEIIAANNQA